MIIWLASYPRSGNTFCRTLLQSIYGMPSSDPHPLPASVKAVNVAPSIKPNITKPKTQESLATSREYYFLKTHEMPQEDHPALYLVRDGRDACVSYAHFIVEFVKPVPLLFRRVWFRRTLRSVIEKDYYGGWGPHVLAWTSRSTPTAVIKFEDLVVDPRGTLRQALEKLGYLPPELPDPQIPEFDTLHREFPNFYRKGQVGTWRKEMPSEVQTLFWGRYGEAMEKMGYSRD